MAVPYTFANATVSIPLSQLDSNFATAITLGNTAIQLGNTVTTLNNMTLANVTVSSGNATFTTANVTNMSSSNVTITGGTIANVTISGSGSNITATNINASNVTVSTDLTLSGGTANGVAYLNGSKVLTTGSALTFDGTNFGIGTASPGAKFELVAGRAKFVGNSDQYNIELKYNSTTGSAWLGCPTTDQMGFYLGGGGSEQMRLTSTGLGIGTSSPGRKLDVSAPAAAQGIISTTTANAAYLLLQNSADSSNAYVYATGKELRLSQADASASSIVTFATQNTERMRIDSSGGVCINSTTASSSKLKITSGVGSRAVVLTDDTASDCIFTPGVSSGVFRLGPDFGALALYTGTNAGSERMRIDSSGRVGIGVSSIAGNLDVAVTGGGTNYFHIGYSTNGDNYFTCGASGIQVFRSGGTERMRIDSSGNLLVGTTSAIASGSTQSLTIAHGGVGSGYTDPLICLRNTANASGKWWGIYVGDSGATATNGFLIFNQNSVGVYLTDGGTSWTGTSDERLKENLIPITDAANKVSTLRAVTGNFKSDKNKTRRSFLIAQDVQKVLPEAVHIGEDENKTLGLSYTDVIPLLVSAIQEQQEQIEQLKAEVAALKAN